MTQSEIVIGLNSSEAKRRLARYGYNELTEASNGKSMLSLIFKVIKEPMFLLLIFCGSLYMILGDYQEGFILLCSIFLIITITIVQHHKTEKALAELKKLNVFKVIVIRNQKHVEIPARELVPGDCVCLNEGQRIPADGFIIQGDGFFVDESILTGESMHLFKSFENENKLFCGCLIVRGDGIMEVTSTGMATEIGKIGKSLSSISSELSPLQIQLRKLIEKLSIVAVAICLLIVAAYYFNSTGFVQSVLNGLTAAMAILPEEFPVVLTVFTILGSWKLSKSNVLTRNRNAIETLGSTTVICTDKTGTITQNKMVLSDVYSQQSWIKTEKNKSVVASAFNLINAAIHASSPNSKDPMDQAIVNAQPPIKVNSEEKKYISTPELKHHKMLISRCYATNDNSGIEIFCKGAPEELIKICELSAIEKQAIIHAIDEMALQGKRIIGVARGIVQFKKIAELQEINNLIFLGLMSFEDPIRNGVQNSIHICQSAGIKILLMTGDYPQTAKFVANKIGLKCINNEQLITGLEIDSLSDQALKQKLSGLSVIARVKPEQKLRIIQLLKQKGEIVAMTGDGVNDAPALKAADIGIAMGQKGTDVAREAASLVLLDDNFSSIVRGITLGRRISDNLHKAFSYILSIHVPIVGLAIIPAIIHELPILLMPLHIVLLELFIDPTSSVAFESQKNEEGIMERKPKTPEDLFFGWKAIIASVGKGLLLLLMVILVYLFSHNEGHSDQENRTITFSALILGNIALVANSLTNDHFRFFSNFKENKYAQLILFIALSVLILILSFPKIGHIFSLENPGYFHLIPSILGAIALYFFYEMIKWKRNKLLYAQQ